MGTITLVFQPKIRFAFVFDILAEGYFFVRLSGVVVLFVVQPFVFPDIVSWQAQLLTLPAD